MISLEAPYSFKSTYNLLFQHVFFIAPTVLPLQEIAYKLDVAQA